MGIDVGSVKSVGQIGSPWSVNSLAQRLGRSGRKEGEHSEIRIYIEEYEPGPDASILDRLFPELLQAIAMTELMLAKWCEPPEVDKLHLSTLVQQVMSVIAETGGARAEALHARLLASGAFPTVGKATFLGLLRSMGKADLLEQTPEGLLILGLEGERIVRGRDFYTAFIVPQEFRVLHSGRHVGNVSAAPDLGADRYLILAGRRWQVLEVDLDRLEILVEPSPGGRVPSFSSRMGADVHPKVREMMKALLFRDDVPTYLDPAAKEMLTNARAAARDAELDRRAFLQDGLNTIWFPWTGSRIQRTLAGLGRYYGGLDVEVEDVALVFGKVSEPAIRETYSRFLVEPPAPAQLAARFPATANHKYDGFLADELQAEVFANDWLDVEGALESLKIFMFNDNKIL